MNEGDDLNFMKFRKTVRSVYLRKAAKQLVDSDLLRYIQMANKPFIKMVLTIFFWSEKKSAVIEERGEKQNLKNNVGNVIKYLVTIALELLTNFSNIFN